MREIKFKVWDIGKKVFIPEAVYALLFNGELPFGVMLKDWENYQEGEYFYSNSQIPLQYTGLKDKKGKDIYDGDVLCCPHFPANGSQHYLYHEIMWDEKLNLWKAVSIGNPEGKDIKAHGNPMLWVYIKNEPECEVIGNIYENPELLNPTL